VRNVDFSALGTTRKSLRFRAYAVSTGAALAFMAGLAGAKMDNSETPAVPATEPVTATAAEAPGATVPAADPALAAAPVEAAPAPAPAKPPAPTDAQLHPVGITAAQQSFEPSAEQLANAKAIVDAGKAMNLPPRAWVIAVATAAQESTLQNLGHLGDRNDHDSQGLFQQRPSTGWGTPEQITDPNYAATAFYSGLKDVGGWDSMPLTEAAQTVQVSAYPDHYAKWEKLAGDLIKGVEGEGPLAGAAAAAGIR
jgi:hypothetical protein